MNNEEDEPRREILEGEEYCFGGTVVRVEVPPSLAGYVDGIMYQWKGVEPGAGSVNSVSIRAAEHDSPGFNPKAQTVNVDEGGRVYGLLRHRPERAFVASPGRYVVVSWGKGGEWAHACVSAMPEFLVAGFLRRHALKELEEVYNGNLVVCHAGCVVDQKGKGIVFSSPDTGSGARKYGKTTSVIACARSARYGFYANDEVVVGERNDQVGLHPLPHDIPVRERSFNDFFEGVNEPKVEARETTDRSSGERVLLITPASLGKAGFSVIPANREVRPRHWFFVSLNPKEKVNTVDKLEEEKSRKLLEQSVFEAYMQRMSSPLPWGEIPVQSVSINRRKISDNAMEMYESMRDSGVTFWYLRGGMKLDNIREAVDSVVE